MGKRGPKGKPAAIKRIEGNPGKRKIPEGFVDPEGRLLRPDHLTGYAAEVWDRVVGAMPDGVYKSTDVDALAAYCSAADELRDAVQHLWIEGRVLQTVYGPKRNPWVVVANQARAQIASIGSRLGLDPMARENIKAPDKKPPSSKFTGLVGIDGGRKAG